MDEDTPKYSTVASDCPACGNPDALAVYVNGLDEDADAYRPEIDNVGGDSALIWVSPEVTKAAMGAHAQCHACGTQFQLRMLVIETMRLPMQFVQQTERKS